MIIIHLIKNNDPKVKTFKYKGQQYLEIALRGYYSDLVLIHGLNMKDVSDNLMKTLKLLISERNGLIIFMCDNMRELAEL